MTKNLKITLIILFLFQIAVAMGFELAHDEAYYWIYSRHLDWGFFDHPPFVGVVIKLFSFLPHTEIAVRIGFIILQFLSLFLIFGLTANWWIGLLLFFSFPLASFTGLLALPDIPLLFMSACYCYQLKKYLENDSLKNSSLLGLIIALLFYAKYHGVLLVFFTIIAVPKLLIRKSFYLVAAVALVCFFPHMWWQYAHDFSTLRYHFLERPKSNFDVKRSLEFIGLQIALAGVLVGPTVWWITIKNKSADSFHRSLKFISIGTVLFFLFSSFSKKIEANWTIFLAIPLIVLVADSKFWEKKWARTMLLASFVIVVGARVLFFFNPETTGMKRLKEFHGWKQWAQEIKQACGEEPILANSYQIASKLSYYLGHEISALNYQSRKNQFDYWHFEKDLPTKQVCYVTDKKQFVGSETMPPDGKVLRIVKNQDLNTLLELKYKETR